MKKNNHREDIITMKKQIKKQMKKYEYNDLYSRFWNKYINADILERREIIENELLNAPIWKDWLKESNVPEHMQRYCMSSLLNSYFNDLIEQLRIILNNKEKK